MLKLGSFAFLCLTVVLAQDNVTTEAPTNITTQTAKTTEVPITTPEVPITTPDAPTTTPDAPTTTPSPESTYFSIREANTTCIMVDGDFTFVVEYDIGSNATNRTHVRMPKPSADVKVDGTCKDANGNQWIKIMWGVGVPQSSMKFTFNASTDLKNWSILTLEGTTYLDPATFANATDKGKALISKVHLEMNPFEIPLNHSFKCFTRTIATNISTMMAGKAYGYPMKLEMDSVQLQAFNEIPHELDFVEGVHCTTDEIADIVPIAVGCALAILILIVLVAYLIGRRRRAASYQSV